MAENSKIEWTDHTFNPWIGCTKVGPGCDNCYAENMMDHRFHRVQWGAGNTRMRTSPANWRMPISWNNRAANGSRSRVFCASLADVFDNEVPPWWRIELFDLIRNTANLDWLLLTKRIGNVERMLPPDWGLRSYGYDNVWLGITVVTQEEADRDIPKLLAVPARIRFLSCEPLVESIDLRAPSAFQQDRDAWLHLLDWVIVGGESGANARPLHENWCLDIARQCAKARTAFFMKQGSQANWPHWKEFERWNDEIQVREFPVETGQSAND